MTLLNRLKFWKKESMDVPEMSIPEFQHQEPMTSVPSMDHLGMPRAVPGVNEPQDFTTPAFSQPSGSQPFQSQAIPQMQQANQQLQGDQQLQLISSKLDTIKAQLETILQRLDRLERKEEPQRWRNI